MNGDGRGAGVSRTCGEGASEETNAPSVQLRSWEDEFTDQKWAFVATFAVLSAAALLLCRFLWGLGDWWRAFLTPVLLYQGTCFTVLAFSFALSRRQNWPRGRFAHYMRFGCAVIVGMWSAYADLHWTGVALLPAYLYVERAVRAAWKSYDDCVAITGAVVVGLAVAGLLTGYLLIHLFVR
jgi:hypothetical protein